MKPLARDPKPKQNWMGSISLTVSIIALSVSAVSAYINWTSTFVSRRPIIVVTGVIPREPFKPNEENFADVEFKNAGTSPALAVFVSGKSELLTSGRKGDFDNYDVSQADNVVAPSVSFTEGILIRPIEPRGFESIRSESAFIYVHGSVTYRDMWNREHWLKFCYKLDPRETHYFPCREHNDLDTRIREMGPHLTLPD
jgi:hypothetical protein